MRPDGTIQLDVRATFQTDDGAMIYVTYDGLLVLTPEIGARIFGNEDVPLDEYYFYVTPLLQTGAEQYKWLNNLVCIGRGRATPGAVEYRVWSVQIPD
jgi:hypothetical protein